MLILFLLLSWAYSAQDTAAINVVKRALGKNEIHAGLILDNGAFKTLQWKHVTKPGISYYRGLLMGKHSIWAKWSSPP